MRISDWSSDVCSSDLLPFVFRVHDAHGAARFTEAALVDRDHVIACVIEALDETAVRGRGFTRAAVTVTLQHQRIALADDQMRRLEQDRTSTRLNSSH